LHRLRANLLPSRSFNVEPLDQASPFATALPASSGKFLGTRTQILAADAEFVRQHVEWLLQRVAQSDAAGDLIQSRLRLMATLAELAATPPRMDADDPHMEPAPATLSLPEIEEMLEHMSEISPQVRAALLRLLAARLVEKR
jgi:hypothetical protein